MLDCWASTNQLQNNQPADWVSATGDHDLAPKVHDASNGDDVDGNPAALQATGQPPRCASRGGGLSSERPHGD